MRAPLQRLVSALLVVVALPAAAQMKPTFGVSAGASFPTGDFGDAFKSGYNVNALLGFRPPVSPVGFRIEGMYSRFDFKGTNAGGVHTNMLAGIGNVVIGGGGPEGTVHPYAIGGVGIYNLKTAANGTESPGETKAGFNIGAGLDLPLSGITAFVEARYHIVLTGSGTDGGSNTAFVPVSVGVRF